MVARRPHSRSGYTLLELMVASAILAVGLTVVMRSFTSGIETLRISEKRSIAAILAQQRLAEIMGQSTLTDGTDQGACEEPWSEFRWQSEIRTMEEYSDLMQVNVVVMWRVSEERSDEVSLTTILRPPPEETESE